MALARQCLRVGRPCCTRAIVSPAVRPFPSAPRLLHTSAAMSKEQIDELQKNPFFDKYAEKIAKLQQTSPEEFLSRLAAQEEAKKPKPVKPRDFTLPSAPKAAQAMDSSGEKTLDKVMKVELLADKSAEEIGVIWTEHWMHKDAVSAVIPYDVYKAMEKRFKEFKTFLFPLPRDMGYEFVIVQFQGSEAHFSTLINFQAHKENAPECLGMLHYTDMAESKGIVLMVGEFDNKVLGAKDAKFLADMLEIYYSRPSGRKLELLQKFTNSPALFRHMDLIEELNLIQLEPEVSANGQA